MAEFRKATRTQESNVLNLKLLISRCEIADTLVTLLYARQRSVALLELCSYAAGNILCRKGHASLNVSRGTKRGALRAGARCNSWRAARRRKRLHEKLLHKRVPQRWCRARQRRRETSDENYHEIRLFNRPH